MIWQDNASNAVRVKEPAASLYGNSNYVNDLIEVVVRLMDTSDDFAGPVIFGNSNECTLRESFATGRYQE